MVKVVVEINGEEISMTSSEARDLYEQLGKIFHTFNPYDKLGPVPYTPPNVPSRFPDECNRIMPPYIVTCSNS